MKFLRELFSDEDGKASASRVLMFILAGFVCGWVSAIVHVKHEYPDQATIIGLAGFITTPYGVNLLRNGFGTPKSNNS